MSSTGTILAAVEPEAQEKVKDSIKKEWAFSMLYWVNSQKTKNEF